MQTLRDYLPLIILIPLTMAVEHRNGPIGVTRLFGCCFVATSVWFCFVAELRVSFGSTDVARLKGWAKAFAIVPVFCIGVCLVAWAPAITCFSTKYKHLCV